MEQLYELYYNPKTGFMSAYKLYLKLNKQVPMKTIQDFLQRQQVHQLHQKPRSKPFFKSITVYSVNDQWQIDLIDFSKYSRWNSGFKYLFCGVDVFSRKAFVVAIKSKSDTTEAMRFILAARKPILIQSDNGTEFLNNRFQSLLKENKVRQITVNVGDHKRQGLIERFNRTLESVISIYQESRKTNRYIDVLEEIVHNYNHSHHRGINDTPESRYQTNPKTGTIQTKALNYKIINGNKVRILREKGTFTKGYEPSYSKSIYNVVNGNGYSYSLVDSNGKELKETYKYYQLKKIEASDTYTNEQVERERPMSNRERRNKRELEELERIPEPKNKRRKIFQGTYFLE